MPVRLNEQAAGVFEAAAKGLLRSVVGIALAGLKSGDCPFCHLGELRELVLAHCQQGAGSSELGGR